MITFAGDLFLGNETFKVQEELLKQYNESEIIVVNFENVLQNHLLEKREDKSSCLTFKETAFHYFKKTISNKLILTMGNNHIHDLGQEGIKGTLGLLKDYEDVFTTGVGLINELNKPLIFQSNNKKIAILTVSTDEPEVMSILATDEQLGVLDYNESLVINTIISYKKVVDYFIVIPHWGKEYIPYPSIQQRNLAYKWIDSGADLVIGHHSHVIQGKEIYKDKFIYYSLGNFIFPEFYYKEGHHHKWKTENNQSISLEVKFADQINIKETGLHFDIKNNSLNIDKKSLKIFKSRSEILDIKKVSKKIYFGIWQKKYFEILQIEYSKISRLKNLFSKHEKYSRLGYFFSKLLKFIK